jgi:hypothetical protein
MRTPRSGTGTSGSHSGLASIGDPATRSAGGYSPAAAVVSSWAVLPKELPDRKPLTLAAVQCGIYHLGQVTARFLKAGFP